MLFLGLLWAAAESRGSSLLGRAARGRGWRIGRRGSARVQPGPRRVSQAASRQVPSTRERGPHRAPTRAPGPADQSPAPSESDHEGDSNHQVQTSSGAESPPALNTGKKPSCTASASASATFPSAQRHRRQRSRRRASRRPRSRIVDPPLFGVRVVMSAGRCDALGDAGAAAVAATSAPCGQSSGRRHYVVRRPAIMAGRDRQASRGPATSLGAREKLMVGISGSRRR